MTREDVYKLIDGEREYQIKEMNYNEEEDRKRSVADWIIFIEHYISQAKEAIYMLDKKHALRQIRKIAALSVACMEVNNTDIR